MADLLCMYMTTGVWIHTWYGLWEEVSAVVAMYVRAGYNGKSIELGE